MKEPILNENEIIFKEILLSVGDGVIATDKNCLIKFINPAAEKITGFHKKTALDQEIDQVLNIGDEDIDDYEAIMNNSALTKVVNSRERSLINKKGLKRVVEETISLITNKNKELMGMVVVFRDITEKKEAQKTIEKLSYNDYLTGLFNRRYMEVKLAELDNAENYPLGIMFLDVNGLKLTNDAFGHDKGDNLLKEVARIIKKESSKKMIVARTGGDEFSVIVPKTNNQEMNLLQKRILKTSAKTTVGEINISLASGYAIKKDETVDIKEIKIKADNLMYKNKLETGRMTRSKIIEKIIISLNNDDEREQIHAKRVTELVELLVKKMCFNDEKMQEIITAANLHDIGKVTVLNDILKKQKITKSELESIRQHAENGYQLLKAVDEYHKLAEYILYHHEWWNGEGYPHGLKGEEIPLESRIIAIADAFEAMTAERSYRAKKTKTEALKELEKCAGTQFDPKLVEIFVEMMRNE